MKSRLGHLAHKTLALPRFTKRMIAVAVDIALCIISVWLAFYLRLGEFIPLFGDMQWKPKIAVIISICIAIPIFIVSGFYRAIFRYSGWPALVAVARAIIAYGILYSAIFTAFGVPYVPRTVGIIQPILLLLLVGASRALAKLWLGHDYEQEIMLGLLPRVLIYGAGSAGRKLAAALSSSNEMRVIGFIDDDHLLQKSLINGLLVYGSDSLSEVVTSLGVRDVLLAIPSVSRNRRNDIIQALSSKHISVRTIPGVGALAQGKVSVSDIRELDIDDLLGREPVVPNDQLLKKNIVGKVVLVTGAGGSIGAELCRQIINLQPKKLLLIDQSEHALYLIHQELHNAIYNSAASVIPLLASVQDEDRIEQIISVFLPDTVYHAAAYKHVPLVEHNIIDGIRNNLFGTLKTARLAIKYRVSDFVLVSTDKAVRPTNIMGASKRLSEMVLQAYSENTNTTRFTMVRFGNVLGSSGSVVPKFREQIRNGGPISLTHSDITRFFMTIPEAAQLVIQAGAMANGGDVFVLDMGTPVKIIDLARRMVELSGLTVLDENNPDGDISINITGLRPGEKLYEELIIGDNVKPTSHPRIMRAEEGYLPWKELEIKLEDLEHNLKCNDLTKIRLILRDLVSGYNFNQDIADWIFIEQASGVSSAITPLLDL